MQLAAAPLIHELRDAAIGPVCQLARSVARTGLWQSRTHFSGSWHCPSRQVGVAYLLQRLIQTHPQWRRRRIWPSAELGTKSSTGLLK